jgi:hypothetical protein
MPLFSGPLYDPAVYIITHATTHTTLKAVYRKICQSHKPETSFTSRASWLQWSIYHACEFEGGLQYENIS